ncbi:MAG: HIT family protein [Cellulosilyticum sp.]|nr:HIT family protein [Cellulosilyticum sp.]
MNKDCIFCKIIKGEIPSFTVYEDDTFKVILDRFPAAPGHALIIPKNHASDMFELPEETAAKLYPLAQKLGAKIKVAVEAEGMNIVQNNGEVAGQSVHHFHLHMIPRKAGDQIILNKSSNGETTLEELEAVLKKIQGC